MPRQSNHRRPPQWQITPRDLAIFGEVLRWQQLTTRQIARWFFDSPRTATNRIAVLLTLGYLRTIDLPWRAPVLVTATPKAGRARSDLGLKARASQPGRLLHDLTVVEVAAWLLEEDLRASWITERELLRDQLEQARDPAGRLRQGPSRRPDGVLVRSSGQEEAVEVELTPKRDRTEYDRKLGWYLGQLHYTRVHWFAPSPALRDRLIRVAQDLRMEDIVTVSPLPSGQTYPPGVRPDRYRGPQPHSGLTASVGGGQPRFARCSSRSAPYAPDG